MSSSSFIVQFKDGTQLIIVDQIPSSFEVVNGVRVPVYKLDQAPEMLGDTTIPAVGEHVVNKLLNFEELKEKLLRELDFTIVGGNEETLDLNYHLNILNRVKEPYTVTISTSDNYPFEFLSDGVEHTIQTLMLLMFAPKLFKILISTLAYWELNKKEGMPEDDYDDGFDLFYDSSFNNIVRNQPEEFSWAKWNKVAAILSAIACFYHLKACPPKVAFWELQGELPASGLSIKNMDKPFGPREPRKTEYNEGAVFDVENAMVSGFLLSIEWRREGHKIPPVVCDAKEKVWNPVEIKKPTTRGVFSRLFSKKH